MMIFEYQTIGLRKHDINRATILHGNELSTIEFERDHFNELIRKFDAKYDRCVDTNGVKLRLMRMDTKTQRSFAYRGKSIGIRDRDIFQCIEDPNLTLSIFR